ncbi:MAG: hypothetical protein DWQ04_15000, partial [Chloroflexi bacterium]
MKKITFLLLTTFLILVTAAGCGPAAPESTEDTDPVQTAPFASDSIERLPTPTSQPEKNELQQTSNDDTISGIFPTGTENRPSTALGDPNAPIVIVEYSDYQCPFCRRHVLETMPQIKANFIDTGQVYYVFKDFPIESLHPLAYRLHEAALCAGQSDGTEAYWQAHDLFFVKAERFQADNLEAMDTAILSVFPEAGLPDITQCLAINENAAVVQETLSEGLRLEVTGTPAFFINGYPISGAQPYELFEYAIELAKAGQLADAYRPREANNPPPPAAGPVDIHLNDEPAKGSLAAPITIVEYSDYQCPFCRRHVLETMPQLQEYIDNGTVRYVFKDYPLHNIHPQAQKAH